MSRLSWGAVIAGTVIAVMVHLTLSLLGIAIGLAVLGPATDGAPITEVGIGAMIWWVLSMLVALFAGAWVAGRLAGIPRTLDASIHGILTWALATLLTLLLMTTAIGTVIGGAFGIIGQAVGAAAPVAGDAVQDLIGQQDITVDEIRAEAQELQARVDDERLMAFFDSLVVGEPVTPAERDAAVDALAQETELSPQEAEQTVDRWIRTSEDVHQQLAAAERRARQVAEDVAEGVALASFWAFVAFVLGAIVAAVGGRLGTPTVTETTRVS